MAHGKYLDILSYHTLIILVFVSAYTPLLYIYTSVITGKKDKFESRELLHFIPLLTALVMAIFIILQKQQAPNTDEHTGSVHIMELTIHIMIFIQYTIYMTAIFYMIKGHSKNIELAYSAIESVNLRWLKILLLLIVCTAVIDIVLALFFFKERNWDILWLFVSLYMYLIGYFALRQPEIFFLNERSIHEKNSKYKKSTLTKKQADEIIDKINEAMDDHKIFLTENLTLPAFAAELSVSVHHLSQVINEHFNMNFFEFINRRRVEEAGKLILDTSHTFTMADIALNVGFNSISAFNSAFKRFTGQTPSQFKSESK